MSSTTWVSLILITWDSSGKKRSRRHPVPTGARNVFYTELGALVSCCQGVSRYIAGQGCHHGEAPSQSSKSRSRVLNTRLVLVLRPSHHSHIPRFLPIYLSRYWPFVNSNHELGATAFSCPGHQVSGPHRWSRKCREDDHLTKSLRHDRESEDI